MTQVGTNGIPRSGINRDKNIFATRTGLAYRLMDKLVLRSAYGIYYAAPQFESSRNLAVNPPLAGAFTSANNQNNFVGARRIEQGFDMPQPTNVTAGTGINLGTPNLPNVLHQGAQLSTLGGADSWFSYGSAWAKLSNTTWRMYKHYSHEGGISSPLIVHWPSQIKTRGQWRTQAGHIVDGWWMWLVRVTPANGRALRCCR